MEARGAASPVLGPLARRSGSGRVERRPDRMKVEGVVLIGCNLATVRIVLNDPRAMVEMGRREPEAGGDTGAPLLLELRCNHRLYLSIQVTYGTYETYVLPSLRNLARTHACARDPFILWQG
jgi:hypothetical protein